MDKPIEKGSPASKSFKMENGTLYFTKEIERKIFFILTMIMLVAGLLAKAGII